eukprot:1160052-Pelagomonas_calceolata.AAC.6
MGHNPGRLYLAVQQAGASVRGGGVGRVVGKEWLPSLAAEAIENACLVSPRLTAHAWCKRRSSLALKGCWDPHVAQQGLDRQVRLMCLSSTVRGRIGTNHWIRERKGCRMMLVSIEEAWLAPPARLASLHDKRGAWHRSSTVLAHRGG